MPLRAFFKNSVGSRFAMRLHLWIEPWAVPLLVFLLPWQAVWILSPAPLVHGTPWDLGTVRFFLVLFLILVCGGICWRRIAHLPTFLIRPTLVLPGFAWVSVFWSSDHVLAMQQACFLSVSALLALLILSEQKRERLRAAFVLALCLQALFAVVQFGLQRVDASTLLGVATQIPTQLGVPVIDLGGVRYLRASGTFPHPNILGAWLVAGILLTFAPLARPLIDRGETSTILSLRVLWLLALGLLLCGLLVTFSRSAFLALCVSALTWVVVMFVRRELRGWRWMLAPTLLVFGCLCLALQFFSPFFLARTDFSVRLEQKSVSDRAQTIRDGWVSVLRTPLLGTGIGNFSVALQKQDPTRTGYLLQPPHIALLALTAELGVVGFLLLVGACVKKLMTLRRSGKHLLPMLPFLLFLLTVSFFDHFLYTLWPGLALSGFLGGWAVSSCFAHTGVVEDTEFPTIAA